MQFPKCYELQIERFYSVAAIRHPGDLAKQFAHAKPADVAEILKTLETLGRARRGETGKYRA